ncbi:hypothetical protein B0H19DRAFT_1374483 [Mycena capillaripes]|nr:hypothetical protein B0H19DRAFT_1374483 [Mycena capillaripes]
MTSHFLPRTCGLYLKGRRYSEKRTNPRTSAQQVNALASSGSLRSTHATFASAPRSDRPPAAKHPRPAFTSTIHVHRPPSSKPLFSDLPVSIAPALAHSCTVEGGTHIHQPPRSRRSRPASTHIAHWLTADRISNLPPATDPCRWRNSPHRHPLVKWDVTKSSRTYRFQGDAGRLRRMPIDGDLLPFTAQST